MGRASYESHRSFTAEVVFHFKEELFILKICLLCIVQNYSTQPAVSYFTIVEDILHVLVNMLCFLCSLCTHNTWSEKGVLEDLFG